MVPDAVHSILTPDFTLKQQGRTCELIWLFSNSPSCKERAYRILTVIGASPVCSAPLLQAISHYAIQCNSIRIYIGFVVHPPPSNFLLDHLNKH